MNIIKNLAFRVMISIGVAYSIARQFPAYEDYILFPGFILLYLLLTYLSNKF